MRITDKHLMFVNACQFKSFLNIMVDLSLKFSKLVFASLKLVKKNFGNATLSLVDASITKIHLQMSPNITNICSLTCTVFSSFNTSMPST